MYQGRQLSLRNKAPVSVFKTQLRNSSLQKANSLTTTGCPIHGSMKHALNECRKFRARPIEERRTFIKETDYCFRCCGQKRHMRSKCFETVLSSVCQGCDHPSALHTDVNIRLEASGTHERKKNPAIRTSCTQICGKTSNTSKSCARIVKAVIYPRQEPDSARHIYCIIDVQISNTLATSKFFDSFHEYGPEHQYTLKSCS